MAKKPTFQQVKTSPFAVRPPKSTGPNPLADLGELGGGAMRVASRGVDYLRRSTPQKVGSDAVGMAKNLYDQVKADPVKFGFETLAQVPQAIGDFAEARSSAQKLRASGELDAARRLEEGAASILLGAIPVIGKAGKGASKAGKVAEEGVEGAVEKEISPLAVTPKAPKAPKTSAPTKAPTKGMLSTPDLRTMSTEDAVRAALTEPHLILGSDGYVGAPAGVSTPEQIAAMRVNFDKDVEAGSSGADWYARAREFNKEIAGPNPNRQRLAAQEEALWSAQASPDTNFNFMLQGHNAYEAGKPLDKVRTPQQALTYNEARNATMPSVSERGMMGDNGGPPLDEVGVNIPLGKKTGVYGKHLDPTSEYATTGTNDIWHARGFGYTDTGGDTFSRALTEQEHRFLDYETMLAVDRANAKKLGGRDNWTAAEIQAAPWVAGKGRGLALTRFHDKATREAAKLSGEGLPLTEDQLKWGLGEAAKTYPDYANKYTAYGTYEETPGPNTGHLTGLSDMPYDIREKYAEDPRSNWSPEGRDVVYDALSMYQREPLKAMGAFKPEGKTEVEFNPAQVSRPLVGVTEGDVTPASRALMNSAEALRSVVGAQEAGAWHKHIRNASPGEMGSIHAPLPEPRALTREELTNLSELGSRYGLPDVVDTGQGATLTAFYPNTTPTGTETGAALKKGLAGAIRGVSSDFEPERTKMVSGYVGFGDEWKEGQGSGAVTKALLGYLQDPEAPNALAKLDTQEIRMQAQNRMDRDYDFAKRYNIPVREDLQNLRRIIATQGVGALKGALKRGEFLPAVAAALGLGAIAGQPEDDGSS
jgi:hypothetical protein